MKSAFDVPSPPRKTAWNFKPTKSEKKLPPHVQLKHIHQVHATLEVFLKSAKDLIACDSNGFSDPCCLLSVGNLSLKSEVKKRTLNPNFNEYFDFSVNIDESNKPLDLFNIQVWNNNIWGKTHFMGNCFVDLTKLERDVPQDFELDLDVQSGKIQFQLIAHNFGVVPQQTIVAQNSASNNRITFQPHAIDRNAVPNTPKTEESSPSKNTATSSSDGLSGRNSPTAGINNNNRSSGKRMSKEQQYKKNKQLSKGGQGTVYKVLDVVANKERALKRVVCNSFDDANRAMEEVWPIRALKHENVVDYKDLFIEGIGDGTFGVCLVMEFYQFGDLDQYLKRRAQKKKYTPPGTVVSYLLQLASALDYLHKAKIMHRDIKPQNVFLTDNYNKLKLGDFGMVKSMDQSMASSQCGSPPYMAPEIGEGKKYFYAADIWSLGVLAYELMTLKMEQSHYLQALKDNKGYRNTIRSDMLAIYKTVPELIDIVLDMLQLQPEERLTAEQCVQRLKIVQEKLPRATV